MCKGKKILLRKSFGTRIKVKQHFLCFFIGQIYSSHHAFCSKNIWSAFKPYLNNNTITTQGSKQQKIKTCKLFDILILEWSGLLQLWSYSMSFTVDMFLSIYPASTCRTSTQIFHSGLLSSCCVLYMRSCHKGWILKIHTVQELISIFQSN